MTNCKLTELLAEAGGGPVTLDDGRNVVMLHELGPFERDTSLRVKMQASSEHLQGLVLEVRSGTLEVNDAASNEMVFWADTAPPEFAVMVKPDGSPTTIRAWNVWLDHRGVEHAWIGDAGIVVQQAEHRTTLLCSDGFDAPTFDDLTVQIVEEGS